MTILRHTRVDGRRARIVPEGLRLLSFLTDFADQAVIVPVAGVVLLVLLWRGQARLALAWGAAVFLGLAGVAAFKLLAFACARQWSWIGLRSPSGHVAAATTVYGGLALLCLTRKAGWLVALTGGVLIAVTRLGLGAHTPADTVAGLAVGCLALGVLSAARRGRISGARWVVGVAALLAIVLHGSHVAAEPVLHRMAPSFWPFSMCRG